MSLIMISVWPYVSQNVCFWKILTSVFNLNCKVTEVPSHTGLCKIIRTVGTLAIIMIYGFYAWLFVCIYLKF